MQRESEDRMTETRMDRMDRRDGALLRRVGDAIFAEPERYNQSWYFGQGECGTTACLAGHLAVLIADDAVPPDSIAIGVKGRRILLCDVGAEVGLSDLESARLFREDWRPAGDPATPLHERVRDALYALSEGATVDEVTAGGVT